MDVALPLDRIILNLCGGPVAFSPATTLPSCLRPPQPVEVWDVIRSDLSEKERLALFSGHSLRAGLASSAEVDERYVQKHLGHASAEITRRYQRRRDRFRVNLTKAAGL